MGVSPNLVGVQMGLTELKVRKAQPREKMYRLSDQKGLYLQVHPNGSKYWRYKYRVRKNGRLRETLLALGTYPEISLAIARERHWHAHQMRTEGRDPATVRRQQKELERMQAGDTFGAVGEDWFVTQSAVWSETHRERQERLLTKELAPLFSIPIRDVKAPLLLSVIRKIEDRGVIETARRTNQIASQVFRHGIALGMTEADPAAQITRALRHAKPGHFAAVTNPDELGPLLATFDVYRGTPVVRAALKLTPLLLVRPGELRHMEWSELRLDDATWTIPGTKMKRGRDHVVPLATQSLSVLRDLRALTGNYRWVFPSARSASRPMSEVAVLAAMRRMGISKDEATPHGFRATARTMLAEVLDYRTELIEHQLAHAVRDATGEAYNRTRFLPQRREMMQAWADYLDRLQQTDTLQAINAKHRERVTRTL